MPQEVEKYRKPIRVLHWIHTCAFITLFLTGLVLFVPGLGAIAQDSVTRIIHRVGAVIFIIIPLWSLLTNWTASWKSVGEAFTWGGADLDWLKAAPRYYFLGDKRGMPPQDHMNSGQKMWWFMTIVFGVVFILTGLVMWFLKIIAPAGLLQWMVLLHDISFIVTGAMLFVHIYLGVLHPMMTESWGAMFRGKISVEYAKSQHAKWYARISKATE